MICGTCGCDNPDRLIFCQECGQRLGPRVAAPTPPIGVGIPPAAFAVPPAAPAPPAATAVAAPAGNVCSRCGSRNEPSIRYCVTCGYVLAAHPPAPTGPAALPPVAARAELSRPASAVAPPPPVAAPPPAAPAPEAARSCPRCRGNVDPGAQFCRFCGAPLNALKPAPYGDAAAPPRASLPAETPPPVVARPPVPVGFPVAASVPPRASPVVVPEIPPVGSPPPLAAGTLAPPPTRPDLPTYGRLVVITREGGEGASYPLRDQVDIGRSQGDVVIADDPYLSPRHARIVRREGAAGPNGGGFVLVDLASTNGVYLRLSRDGSGKDVPLEDQDLFLVGQQVLKFDVVREAEEGLAPATQHGTLLFGTPIVPRFARIRQQSVEGVTRDVFHVHKAETVLGRESGDIVFTDDPFLSRRHAAVRFESASRRFVLADLGSSNGTFIQIRGEVSIRSGDQFRIGQQLFRVDLATGSPAPAPPP